MANNRTKIMRLTGELVDFFMESGIRSVDVHLDLAADHFSITVKGQTNNPPAALEQLTEALMESRQPDMDEYYDNLVGSAYRDQGYHMLGALVDESEVRYTAGILTIKIRQNGHFVY